MIRVSKSSIECFARCPQLYQYKYVLGYQSKYTGDTLTTGLIFHDHVEAFWQNAEIDGIDFDAFEEIDNALICEAMVESYTNKYDLEGVKVLATEEKHELETKYGQRVAVFDAIIEYAGRTLLVETKTTSQYLSGDWYWGKLDLDLQIGYYSWFAKKVGYPIDGILYDVTRVPKMKIGKDGRKKIKETEDDFYNRVLDTMLSSPDDYHQRRLIQVNEEDIMDQVDMWERNMHNAATRGGYPRNHTACFMYGRKCEFKPVCTGNSSLDNERLYQLRKKK